MKDPIVVTTAEQLRAIVADGVAEALAKVGPRKEVDTMTCGQAAALIGVHPHTVPRLVRSEGLPTLRRVGRCWRFSRRDVTSWLAQRKAG